MKLTRLLAGIGQAAVALVLGSALWAAGHPVLAVLLALLVAGGVPVAIWWLFEREPPLPSGSALTAEIARDELVLDHHEALLGTAHPQTLTTRNNLAFDYALAGRLDEAIAHYEIALTFAIHVQGPDHPETLIVRRNLADAQRQALAQESVVSSCEAARSR